MILYSTQLPTTTTNGKVKSITWCTFKYLLVVRQVKQLLGQDGREVSFRFLILTNSNQLPTMISNFIIRALILGLKEFASKI